MVTRNRNIPNNAISTIPLPAYFSDSCFSPAPRYSEKLVALPIPRRSDIAVHVVESGNAILVAAFPSMPIPWPINIWSTIL